MSGITRRVIALAAGAIVVGAVSANAQSRRGAIIVVPRAQVYRPYVYDPFWGPWYPYSYGYAYVGRPETDIKTHVTPKNAEVYVDGFFAGRAADFDGVFKKLHVAPGGHAITLHLDGFRTTTQEVYVRPDSTFKMNVTMAPLAPGEASAPVPAPARSSPRRRYPFAAGVINKS
jgi:PEGA domain-containing protein